MNAASLAVGSFALLGIAYKFYGGFLRERIFGITNLEPSPAVQRNDGVEFVPTNRWVLFGHQFASIAGLGPIVGPAIAVVWGWLPALLWVVFGSIFVGGVHDFGALAASLGFKGCGMGEITQRVVGRRAKNLFLVIIFFLLALAMGVFAILIAGLFIAYPKVVIPVFGLIVLAMLFGTALKRWGVPLGIASWVGVSLNLGLILVGIKFPILWSNAHGWITVLLIYALLASVLPIWLLLTPRDYLNSYKLYLSLGAILVGLLMGADEFKMVAPAVQSVAGAPSLFPFLFITIACGACSGFHSLVSSGTTVRQLKCRTDSQMMGYGAMLMEGALAVLVILACTAGVGADFWNENYQNWATINAKGVPLRSFVEGAGAFIARTGLDLEFAKTFIAVVVIAFAMTTLDSATRLLRYNIEEIGTAYGTPSLRNKWTASIVAVVAIAFFAFLKMPNESGEMVPAGLLLWQLFGTTNQLLGGLALLVVTAWLVQRKRPSGWTYWPMILMFTMTLWAMVVKLLVFWGKGQWGPLGVGAVIFALALLIIWEAVGVLRGAN
ncbi:carbon starvation protein A [bacterium]|nr:carbon starvation protein A [bacterium]